MLSAPHEDHERLAFRGLVIMFAARVLVIAVSWGASAKYRTHALPFLATVGTVGVMFFLPYWLITLVLRRVPQDAHLLPHHAPPFEEPPEWTATLNAIPHVASLTPHDRMRLGSHLDRFLRQVRFEGAQGLEVTQEMRLVVAAQACLLTLNLPRGALGRLKTIILYPTAFVARTFSWHAVDRDEPGTPALGESWKRGTVLLAWDTVQSGMSDPGDGHNVAFHEFAHQLDSLEGDANGIPVLGTTHRYRAWVEVLEASFGEFRRRVRKGHRSALDPYGATNHAEFFAVATESFFEKPKDLQKQFPELYEQLRGYYRQDPAVQTGTISTD